MDMEVASQEEGVERIKEIIENFKINEDTTDEFLRTLTHHVSRISLFKKKNNFFFQCCIYNNFAGLKYLVSIWGESSLKQVDNFNLGCAHFAGKKIYSKKPIDTIILLFFFFSA